MEAVWANLTNGNVGQWVNETVVDQSERNPLNPLGLTLAAWIVAVTMKTVGVVLIDPVVLVGCKLFRVAKLPSRVPFPIMKGLESLTFKDYAFLCMNQIIEAVGMMYFASFVWFETQVEKDLQSITLGNTVGFVYFVFLFDDFFYYWAHRAMHLPSLYPWCHKHHHRQSMPRRGYFDAANEHPLEQVIGLSIVLGTFRAGLLYYPFGVHAFGILAFILIYAVTAFLNHTEYDVQFGLLGLGYNVRAHEMHHRFPQCNYAQNTMLWDRILGTFQEYRDGNQQVKKAE